MATCILMLSQGTLLCLESCSSLFCQTTRVFVTYNAVMSAQELGVESIALASERDEE